MGNKEITACVQWCKCLVNAMNIITRLFWVTSEANQPLLDIRQLKKLNVVTYSFSSAFTTSAFSSPQILAQPAPLPTFESWFCFFGFVLFGIPVQTIDQIIIFVFYFLICAVRVYIAGCTPAGIVRSSSKSTRAISQLLG